LSGSIGNFTVSGALSVTSTTNLSAALSYGGVTLSNSVTGTGSMALSASPTFTGTPAAPTASPGTNTTQIATTAFVLANGIPSGAIIMWSGSIASIPSGWLLCDGTSGTPNLRDRFIVGAGTTYAVAATGGSADAIVVSHTHAATVTDPGHLHTIIGTQELPGGGSGFNANANPNLSSQNTQTNTTGITVTNATAGVSGTNANLPPYYALAYIMKA
jgi:hypothetical protein